MQIKSKWIPSLHPFLFTIFPILFLWQRGIADTSFLEALVAMFFYLKFVVLFLLGLTLVFRDGKRASILVTIFLIFFFSYMHVYNIFQGVKIFGFAISSHRYLLLLSLIIVSILEIVFIFSKKRTIAEKTGKCMNLVGIVLIFLVSINLGIAFVKNNAKRKADMSFYEEEDKLNGDSGPAAIELETLPDIYYIILDSYGSPDILKEEFNYDNSEFINLLKNKGFYLASESRSNYSWTRFSLFSSLNMRYLNDVNEPNVGINKNKVYEFVKSKGYKIISFYPIPETRKNKKARFLEDKVYYCGSLSKFAKAIMETTYLFPFAQFSFFNYYDEERDNTLFVFEKLAEMPKIKDLHFVFAHIYVPHPPFIFLGDGTAPNLKMDELWSWLKVFKQDVWAQKYTDYYKEQLSFVDKKVKVLVDKILANPSRPAIIILQGDHGPMCVGRSDKGSQEVLEKQRLSILNAYYLPKGGNKFLYDSITPVNTFRLIFNTYFGTNFELLEDKGYLTESERVLDY